MSGVRIKLHPLALYFVLAYAFSWAIEIRLRRKRTF